jgi:hypothetical protein
VTSQARPSGTRRRVGGKPWHFYCGAKCRAAGRYGEPCRQPKAKGRKRCRFHAGLATGPRSDAGKARVGEAQREFWRRWREARGLPSDWRYGRTWLSRRQRETARHWLERNGKVKPESESE